MFSIYATSCSNKSNFVSRLHNDAINELFGAKCITDMDKKAISLEIICINIFTVRYEYIMNW